MVGTDEPIKIQAPWAMQRMETRNDGKIIVTDETPTVDLLPDPPVPEQPPLAKDCTVTDKFREGHGHPFSLFINYRCPICDQFHRIALDNVFGPGNRVIRCECGEKVTLGLQFDVPEVAERPEPQMPQDQSKGPWLKFWNPKAAKH